MSRMSFLSTFRRSTGAAVFAAAIGMGVLAGGATAATQDATVTLPAGGVTPGSGGGFGVYNFNVAHTGPNVFPFGTGDKRGHCVEATVLASSGPATLKTDADATPSDSALNNNRLAWLMLSTVHNQDTPGASPLTLAQRADAHQSATWQITDPGRAANILADPAAAAEATRLLAESTSNQAAAQQAAAVTALAPQAPCGAQTRGIQVSGAPFSSADLTITSANGTFTSGGKTVTLDLGPSGTATTGVAAAVGAVTISGTVPQAKLVHVDFATSQDFAYAETSPVPVQLSIDVPPCTTTPAPAPGPASPAQPASDPSPAPAIASSRAVLRLTKRGAKRVRAGRKTTVILKVTNTSKTTARNVVLTDVLPKGTVLARRTPGMTVNGRRVSIRIGSLGPGRMATRRVVISVLRSTPRGRRCSQVTVRSSNANTRRTSCCMIVTTVTRKVLPAVTG